MVMIKPMKAPRQRPLSVPAKGLQLQATGWRLVQFTLRGVESSYITQHEEF